MYQWLIVALLFSTIPAFANEEGIADVVREEVQEFVGDGIDNLYDGVMEEVEIPNNDFINPTDKELENLKDDGKVWIDTLGDLFGATHNVAESGVYVVSDYDLDAWIVSLIGIVVVIVVGVPMMKKVGMDLIKIVLLSVILVAIIAVIGLVFSR